MAMLFVSLLVALSRGEENYAKSHWSIRTPSDCNLSISTNDDHQISVNGKK